MDKLLFVVMIGILIYVTIKNVDLFRRYRQNKTYIDCYHSALYGEENAYEKITSYIDSEKSEEYKNKTRIIKLNYELNNDIEYEKTIEEIDLKSIYYKKGKVDNNLLKLNSDSFIFIMLAMAKAYEKNKIEIIDKLSEKVEALDGLQDRLECVEIKALVNALEDKEDKGSEVFHSLLDGTYSQYSYDKNMIGLYKRVAASMLERNGEEYDEYFKNDLYSFAKSVVGKDLLTSLGLYETYKPVEEKPAEQVEVVEEVVEEEIIEEENKE